MRQFCLYDVAYWHVTDSWFSLQTNGSVFVYVWENIGDLFQTFVPKANVLANHINEQPHHNIDTSSWAEQHQSAGVARTCVAPTVTHTTVIIGPGSQQQHCHNSQHQSHCHAAFYPDNDIYCVHYPLQLAPDKWFDRSTSIVTQLLAWHCSKYGS